jgi:hypothetical protein
MMNTDRRTESDASNVYFLLQVIYLFKGKGQPLDKLVIETIKNFSTLYPPFADDVAQIIAHLEAGEPFKALKVGHKLLADQDKEAPPEIVSPVSAVSAL